jgi:glycosyltransferase involved in cell wall biosynthesis
MAEATFESVTLVVTTYQAPNDLRRVMESILSQTCLPDEVVIADDGSLAETAQLIQEYQNGFPFPVIHSWQPDRLFRLSRSRNLALSRTTSDWIVIIDGDCLLPPEFIKKQLELAEHGCIVFGSRKLLDESVSHEIRGGGIFDERMREITLGRKFWSVPLGILRKYPKRSWQRLRGFLMAMERSMVIDLGGFDESYDSWGLEDSDFAVRAIRRGALLKDGRYTTALIHLNHPEPSKGLKSSNQKKFDALMAEWERCSPIRSIFIEDWSEL